MLNYKDITDTIEQIQSEFDDIKELRSTGDGDKDDIESLLGALVTLDGITREFEDDVELSDLAKLAGRDAIDTDDLPCWCEPEMMGTDLYFSATTDGLWMLVEMEGCGHYEWAVVGRNFDSLQELHDHLQRLPEELWPAASGFDAGDHLAWHDCERALTEEVSGGSEWANDGERALLGHSKATLRFEAISDLEAERHRGLDAEAAERDRMQRMCLESPFS